MAVQTSGAGSVAVTKPHQIPTTSRLSRLNRAEPPKLERSIVEQCKTLPPAEDDDGYIYPSTKPITIDTSSPTLNRSSTSSSSSSLAKMARPGAAPLFSDSPNARSKTITIASGPFTHGALNQHPSTPYGYTIGVADDTGSRRTMEDAHSFVADFAGVRGQGYFAVFDGHAGKHAAEWCGQHFHEDLLEKLAEGITDGSDSSDSSTQPENQDASQVRAERAQARSQIPDLLNKTFHIVDEQLSQLAESGQTHSGCTAVTAFLRLEDERGSQPPEYLKTALDWQRERLAAAKAASGNSNAGGSALSTSSSSASVNANGKEAKEKEKDKHHGSGFGKVKSVMKSITGRSPSAEPEDINPSPTSPRSPAGGSVSTLSASVGSLSTPTPSTATTITNDETPTTSTPNANVTSGSGKTAVFAGATRRVLYTANVGDARAVLSRGGRAVRLTYDHKGSDANEARRIKEAGGFVMNNRVNGVLAVTRSLGDSAMKAFVVGSPYTTETQLGDEDDVLIIACDGLWDVLDDQSAVDLARPIATGPGGPQEAARQLMTTAFERFSSDNVSVIVVRLDNGWRVGTA